MTISSRFSYILTLIVSDFLTQKYEVRQLLTPISLEQMCAVAEPEEAEPPPSHEIFRKHIFSDTKMY